MNVFEENGKFGLKDDSGIILIPCEYEAVGKYIVWEDYDMLPGTPCIPVCKDGKWALRQVGDDEVLMTDTIFDEIFPFDETYLYLAVNDEGVCVFDVLGERLFNETFDRVRNPIYSIALVQKGNQYGMFTDDGLCFVSPQFTEIEETDYPGFFRVMKDGKWGWIDHNNCFTEDESEAWWGYSDDFINSRMS